MSHAGETADRLNFVEQHRREDLADSGDRSQQESSLRVVCFGLAEHFQLQSLQERIVMTDHLQVGFDVVAGALFGEAIQDVSVGGIPQTFLEGIQVDLVVDQLHVRQQFAASADQKRTASEQVARRSHLARIDVAQREGATSHQAGDLLAVDPVVLVLPSVNRFHVERVAEYKVQTFVPTEIRDPVPGKHRAPTAGWSPHRRPILRGTG